MKNPRRFDLLISISTTGIVVIAGALAALGRPALATGGLAPQQGDQFRAYLPVSLEQSGFGAPPVSVSFTPTPSATATPTLVPTELPSATPSPTETPTASPTPDDRYREPLTDRASIDDLRSAYTPGRWYETLLAVLQRRYPTGHYIVTHLADSRTQAAQWTNGRTGTFDDLLSSLELAVHEMNHQLGMQEGFVPTIGKEYFYQVRADLPVKVTVVPTFNRSEIAQYVVGPLDNMYKSTYLTGRSGQQGVFTLLDEFNAYTHSLFTGYGLYDQYPRGQRVSHRDGMVTMMMYLEFYLRHGRQKHPADYAAMRADPAVRSLVKLLWERANFILDTTVDIPALALDPVDVETKMRTADMQDEIQRFLAP